MGSIVVLAGLGGGGTENATPCPASARLREAAPGWRWCGVGGGGSLKEQKQHRSGPEPGIQGPGAAGNCVGPHHRDALMSSHGGRHSPHQAGCGWLPR
ncbi:hypothetical protein MATL_G00123300 [Megalops atlanticus]|uniref:Uncharacterized protein n=1 Tax=Megalops atlanticus TaxID=7932 RepID=A0A9D3PY45_MEGAT|nr:hypothetical protein MATL_G00123300 [Megalops atlanticus]